MRQGRKKTIRGLAQKEKKLAQKEKKDKWRANLRADKFNQGWGLGEWDEYYDDEWEIWE